jgi:hypothetical protein
MATNQGTKRINVTLDEPQAQRLAQMAAEAHMSEGTLARSILSSAIDRAPQDAENVVDLLNRIPAAREETERARQAALAGDTIPLDEF